MDKLFSIDEAIIVQNQEATILDFTFFNDTKNLEFGCDFSNTEDWYRTTSGRAAKVVLKAEDENETIGVLEFETGESEVRRTQSFRPCLFGPASSDAEDFESDVETDTSDSEAEEEDADVVSDLPLVIMPDVRRNRGASWLKMNSLGQLFDKGGEEMQPPSRMTMDAFGNFVVAGTQNRRDPYLEHLKMLRKRTPQINVQDKRTPAASAKALLLRNHMRENLQE